MLFQNMLPNERNCYMRNCLSQKSPPNSPMKYVINSFRLIGEALTIQTKNKTNYMIHGSRDFYGENISFIKTKCTRDFKSQQKHNHQIPCHHIDNSCPKLRFPSCQILFHYHPIFMEQIAPV